MFHAFPRTNYYKKNCFSHSGAILWNKRLPCDVREAESMRTLLPTLLYSKDMYKALHSWEAALCL